MEEERRQLEEERRQLEEERREWEEERREWEEERRQLEEERRRFEKDKAAWGWRWWDGGFLKGMEAGRAISRGEFPGGGGGAGDGGRSPPSVPVDTPSRGSIRV